MNAIALKARWVFPVDGPPVQDGILSIDRGRVVALGENITGHPPLDLGNVALLPGLINAHTHLEFSELPEPLGQGGGSFAQWITAVIAHRRDRDTQPEDADVRHATAVRKGLRECQQSGTVALGEISTSAAATEVFQTSRLDCTVFAELLGLDPAGVERLMARAREHVTAGQREGVAWHAGLSPHAPYSVHPELLPQLCRLSREFRVPVAMHLAETQEELELLESGSGELVSLLQWLGVWRADAIPRGTRPLDYLRVLAQAERALVIHGNYLNREEIEFLAGRADRMSVVYCPRTHAFFGHRHYPLAKLLDCGLLVALGTDSRASNPDLSLLPEMRFIYRVHEHVTPENVLRLGTINPAVSLGLQTQFGSITAGKRADFTTVGLTDGRDTDPYELLFGSPFPAQRLCFASPNSTTS